MPPIYHSFGIVKNRKCQTVRLKSSDLSWKKKPLFPFKQKLVVKKSVGESRYFFCLRNKKVPGM